MISPNDYRKDFPILSRKINGYPLVYFDNAATSQKPQQVIDILVEYYSTMNSNIHRGVHTLSIEATERYEESREKVRAFINARSTHEIIWTKNDTESLNLIAHSWGRKYLEKGDSIILTEAEHHSNIVPWQILSEEIGFKIKYLSLTPEGLIDKNELEEKLSSTVKIVSFTHATNSLGTINDAEGLIKIIRAKSPALIIVDGAQAIPHMTIDVQKLDCDFYTFSAHKMCGPTGVGVLYGKEEILEKMDPFLAGGDMIKEVSLEKTTYNDLPYKFEAGTPNIADVIAFGTAIDYLQQVGMQNIEEYEKELVGYAFEKMKEVEGITIYGTQDVKSKSGIVTFNLKDIHAHDVGSLLDEKGIAIRTGHHCAQPVIYKLGVSSTARASFYFYNTKEEINTMVERLKEISKMF